MMLKWLVARRKVISDQWLVASYLIEAFSN